MGRIAILILIAALYSFSYAQKIIDRASKDTPSWLMEPPSGEVFEYYTGVGSSPTSLEGAKEQAISNLLSEVIMEGTISAESKIKTFHQESNEGIISEVTREILQTGDNTIIRGLRKEEEYWQIVESEGQVIYQYWILMRLPKNSEFDFLVPIDQGYGFTPVLKSAIIPGWGQYHKGEYAKARRILVSETLLITFTTISFYLSEHYNSKAENETDLERRKFFNKWSHNSYSIGTVFGILSAAIYGYNIYDSIVAKGKKKYSFIPERLDFFAYTNVNQTRIGVLIVL